MAPTKAPYDPVKALEGMFYGSVTRIAYALKDPVNYSAPTKTILTECAKRFHDALDDCEIQLLDAKWYLENQLAQNKARRETKAREMGNAAKRKHEEIKEAETIQIQEETPTKRPKIDTAKDAKSPQPKLKTDNATEKIEPQQPPPKPTEQPASSVKQSQPETKQAQVTPQPKKEEVQLIQDDFAKPTPQVTPAGTDEDFNFESMFIDPSNDAIDAKDNPSLEFDIGMDDTFEDSLLGTNGASGNQDPTSLDSLLPGLETYANQSGDNNIGNSNSNNDTLINSNSGAGAEVEGTAATQGFTNDFDLPEIGGPNVFDDFLNDDSLAGGNYEGNGDMIDQTFLDLDLDVDDSFFQ